MTVTKPAADEDVLPVPASTSMTTSPSTTPVAFSTMDTVVLGGTQGHDTQNSDYFKHLCTLGLRIPNTCNSGKLGEVRRLHIPACVASATYPAAVHLGTHAAHARRWQWSRAAHAPHIHGDTGAVAHTACIH
jgi:hypothetical protein